MHADRRPRLLVNERVLVVVVLLDASLADRARVLRRALDGVLDGASHERDGRDVLHIQSYAGIKRTRH